MQRTQKPVKFSQPIFMFEAVGTMFAKKLISEEIVKRNEYFRKKALAGQKIRVYNRQMQKKSVRLFEGPL